MSINYNTSLNSRIIFSKNELNRQNGNEHNKQNSLVIIIKAPVLDSIEFCKLFCFLNKVFSFKENANKKTISDDCLMGNSNGSVFETINVRFINKNLVFIIIAIFATFVLHKKFELDNFFLTNLE